jgi:5'-deoxynucleotidase YfbR-like HD superfamily hydrolase
MSGPPHKTGRRPPPEVRAWQRMLSGRRLDLLDPSPSDIEIEDIAHGLARVARWNGQTLGDHAFSVAQHALLVEEIAAAVEPGIEPRWRLAALLHDAPEYVIGDLISPFKAAIGLDYRAFEAKLLQAIHLRFGLPAALPPSVAAGIKRADRIAAYYEATVLAGFGVDEAARFFGEPAGLPAVLSRALRALSAEPAAAAQAAFLRRFAALIGK